ncbi:hypothetical protein [Tetragenococcus halophilus]|uniref:hypothetical protein n=1 Tax=Tetragenococcus halophilus TaxID=51669 RepID=UPI0034A3A046
MIEEVLAIYDLEEGKTSSFLTTIQEPRQCMHCMNTGKQVFLDGVWTTGKQDPHNGIGIFACPFCGSTTIHFLTHNRILSSMDFEPTEYLSSVDSIPINNQLESQIPEQIKEKFPEFIKIYQQSVEAEKSKLDQIAGMGYRKSLEFLVTDFLLQYTPKEVSKEWLKDPKTSLSNKVSKLENPRLKDLSKAISFIGNDETHYTRRHPEHDTKSIKIFLDALLSEIQNELTYLEAKKLLNKPK